MKKFLIISLCLAVALTAVGVGIFYGRDLLFGDHEDGDGSFFSGDAESGEDPSGGESDEGASDAETGEDSSGSETGEDSSSSESGEDSSGSETGGDSSGNESGEDSSSSESGEDSSGSETGEDSSGSESGEDSSGSETGEDSTVEPHEHVYGDWKTAVEPTCEEAGEEEAFCTVCNLRKTREIQADGEHAWSNYETLYAADRCRDGKRERECDICGATEAETIPGSGAHTWTGSPSTSPSCTDYTYWTRTCSVCEESEQVRVDPIGHSFVTQPGYITEPTCKTPAVVLRICERCYGREEATGELGEHSYVLSHIDQPTVYAVGYRYYTCTVCQSEKAETVPKLTGAVSFNRNDYGKKDIVTTNFGQTYVTFAINGSTLSARGVIEMPNLTRIAFDAEPEGATFYNVCYATSGETFFISVDLSGLTEIREIRLFTEQNMTGRVYSYVWKMFKVGPDGRGGYMFVHPTEVLQNNLNAMETYIDRSSISYTVDDEVKALADSVCAGVSDDYTKMKLLHDWVASNIYYDWDYINNGKVTPMYYMPLDVLRERLTVCEGYARLLEAMLLSQGIAAHRVVCVASQPFVDAAEPNHVYVEAYLESEGRWVILDATWDSGNRYEDGIMKEGNLKSLYFDASIDCISCTHKIMKRGSFES